MKSTPSPKRLTMKQRTVLEAVCHFIQKGERPTVREVSELLGLRSPATVYVHLQMLEAAGLVWLSRKSRGVRLTDEGWRALGLRPINLPPAAREVPPMPGIEPLSWKEAYARAGRKRPAEDVPPGHWTNFASELPVLDSSNPEAAERLGKPQRAFRVPLVGVIAAGKPFESFSDGFFRGRLERAINKPARESWRGSSRARAADETFDEGPALALDPRMFVESGEVFAIRIKGDSMEQAGILDGDYVIIRRQDTVENGEIAAVLIDGEGTLKRWHVGPAPDKKSSRKSRGDGETGGKALHLLPANERFEPIYVTEEEGRNVIVLGKYVGLVRGDIRFL